MPNAIKYNTSAETLALKKGNFWIGTGDVGKGPTSNTGFYNGLTPPSGGYTIYLNKASGGPSIYTVSTVAELTGLTSTIAGQTLTTSGACLNWFATQTDKMIFNIDYPAIVTNGLVLNLDAAFTPSYSQSGVTWYDVSSGGNNGTLTNGPTFNSANSGSIVLDGIDDYISIPASTLFGGSDRSFTLMMWVYGQPSSTGYAGWFGMDGTLNFFVPGSATSGTAESAYRMFYIDPSSPFPVQYQFFQMPVNQWFLLTSTNLDASPSSSMGYSINGASLTTATYPNRMAVPSEIKIGYSNAYINGKVGMISAYNRVLSNSEIIQNYEAIGTRYTSLQVQSLVVAGGGGGGGNKGGGGGAGGLLTGTTTNLTTNTNYTITIGGGGAVDTNGSNSVFNLTTSNGGGAGGRIINTTAGTGGCGGGAGGAHAGNGTGYSGGTPFSGQGYKGGGNYNGVTVLTNSGGGGGGGAGMAGYNALETSGATGGDGLYFSEYSTLGGSPSGWFAGGGGGGAPYNNDRGFGGKGGGGQGAQNLPGYGTQNASGGTVNTGGGGGGGSIGGSGSGFYDGKSGGSGIVILRIPDVYTARFSSGVTSSVTKSGGYKYYKVTATSTTSETVSFL